MKRSTQNRGRQVATYQEPSNAAAAAAAAPKESTHVAHAPTGMSVHLAMRCSMLAMMGSCPRVRNMPCAAAGRRGEAAGVVPGAGAALHGPPAGGGRGKTPVAPCAAPCCGAAARSAPPLRAHALRAPCCPCPASPPPHLRSPARQGAGGGAQHALVAGCGRRLAGGMLPLERACKHAASPGVMQQEPPPPPATPPDIIHGFLARLCDHHTAGGVGMRDSGSQLLPCSDRCTQCKRSARISLRAESGERSRAGFGGGQGASGAPGKRQP